MIAGSYDVMYVLNLVDTGFALLSTHISVPTARPSIWQSFLSSIILPFPRTLKGASSQLSIVSISFYKRRKMFRRIL